MLTRLLKSLAIVTGCMIASLGPALATDCGGDVNATATLLGTYDPFATSGVTLTGTLIVTRAAADHGGGKTQNISFYLRPGSLNPPMPIGTEIQYAGVNVLYPYSGPFPTLANNTLNPQEIATPGSPPYLAIGFGGAAQPVTVSIPITLIAGPNWDVPSNTPIHFDMVFVCKGTGGYQDVTTPTEAGGGVNVSVTILSGLQASYSGPALDFGPIGDVTDAQASSHTVSGQFQVKSSGAFTIDLSSANGYLMTYPLGPTTTPSVGTVKYQLDFEGNVLTNSAPTFTLGQCQRAGIGAFKFIPISATLLEGGVGKTPAPDYQDMLTVTFTPLADPGTSGAVCTL